MPELISTEDSPYWNQQVDLEDTTYTFTFRWNDRESAWYFDIDEQDGSAIVRGQKILPFVDLLTRWADSRLPTGKLLVDAVDSNERPTRESLFNGDVSLIYFSLDELANGTTV